MKRKIVIHGTLAGVMASVLFLGPVLFKDWASMQCEDMEGSEVIGYSAMFFPMLLIVLAMHQYRQQVGKLRFLKALGLGLAITFLSSVVFYLGNVFVYAVLDPNMLPDFKVFYVECLRNAATTAEELAKVNEGIESLKGFWDPFSYSFLITSTIFAMGLLISAISALGFHIRDKNK